MTHGDGIRRNVAKISDGQRARLRDAFIALDADPRFVYPDGVTYWDKQEDIHKSAHAAGQDVHRGPAFLPWHRVLIGRLETLLREADPSVSLHYWDFTTDPRASGNGAGSTTDLFTPQFMGSPVPPSAGPPLQNFESTEGGGHTHIWRDVNGGAPGAPGIGSDASIISTGNAAAQADQYTQFDTAPGGLHQAHDAVHGYIGGSIAQEHFSFHDPFVFLLHSNVDRLLAAWQRVPGQAWRLDPKQVYGSAAASPTIVQDLQPWSGGSGLRPWAPPDNQQVPTNATDLDVVTPVRYDVVLAGGTLAQNADGRVEVFVRGDDNALWHIWQTAPNNGWSNWASLGGNFPGQPIAYQNADGRLEVFVRGDDNALWHIWQTAPNNGWSNWATLGGNIPGSPAVFHDFDGRIEVFARGDDNALWHIWQTAPNNGWSSWATLGGNLPGEPAAFQNEDGRLEVFARGDDNALWHIWQTAPGNGWSGWASLGGNLPGDPVVFQNQDARLEAFARGDDNALWHIWQTAPNNGWSSWATLGGNVPSLTGT